MLIAQRVQLRQDDVPLGEQTVSQVSQKPTEISWPRDTINILYLSGFQSEHHEALYR